MKTIIEEFSIALDDTLIEEFRDTVNEQEFAYNYYHNKDGKNLFNLICSCMDWISVSVRYIKNFPELSDDIDVKSMQVYSLISSIDIMTASIEQLHKAITSDPKSKRWTFKGSSLVFKDKAKHLSHNDDDGYFKEIRSIFGAHPTNLSQNQHDKSDRRFASWPHYHPFNGNDFTVSLYSNIPDEDDVIFGIKINELLQYAKVRYEHLTVLADTILSIRQSYFDELRQKIIPATNNVYDELQLLLVEVGNRQDNDYYRLLVGELINLFDGRINEPHLQQEMKTFKDRLHPIICEIRTNLQEMKLDDLTTDDGVLVSSLPDHSLNYELSKMFSWLHSGRGDPLSGFYFKQLNKYTEGRYNFNFEDNADTTLLKLRMMLFRYHSPRIPSAPVERVHNPELDEMLKGYLDNLLGKNN